MPELTHLGPAAPSGLTRYASRVFGEEYRDNFFATLFNMNKVTRHVLEPSGATFKSRDSDFLVSNSRDFHPTDVLEDADGSLLVLDTGAWYKLCCPTSQLAAPEVLGAIYRVRRTGGPKVEDPRGRSLKWDTMSGSDLAKLLDDPRPAVQSRDAAGVGEAGRVRGVDADQRPEDIALGRCQAQRDLGVDANPGGAGARRGSCITGRWRRRRASGSASLCRPLARRICSATARRRAQIESAGRAAGCGGGAGSGRRSTCRGGSAGRRRFTPRPRARTLCDLRPDRNCRSGVDGDRTASPRRRGRNALHSLPWTRWTAAD